MPTEEPLGLSDCSSSDKVTLGLGTFADVLAYNMTSHFGIYLRSVLLFELLYVQKSSCPPASSPFGRR